jgi:hypothetical protein
MRLGKAKVEHKQLATFIKGGGTLSYTKFSKEVIKWLKANGLPCYGTAYDSPEVTQTRLDAWMQGSKMIARKWISEKRYQELISCAHGGWYQDDVLFEPLAIHFIKNHLFDELRFLCEYDIRHSVKNLLSTIKSEKEEHKTLDITAVQCINVEVYMAGRGYSQLGEIAKYRKKSLDQIIRYIGYLEQIQAPVEYFEMVRDLQKKVVDLSVKPKDLKQICFRLSTEL